MGMSIHSEDGNSTLRSVFMDNKFVPRELASQQVVDVRRFLEFLNLIRKLLKNLNPRVLLIDCCGGELDLNFFSRFALEAKKCFCFAVVLSLSAPHESGRAHSKKKGFPISVIAFKRINIFFFSLNEKFN